MTPTPVYYRGQIWSLIDFYAGGAVIKDIYTDEEIVVELTEINYL